MMTENIYWIGGSPCAGKTTIAGILGQEYDLQLYHVDRHVEDYFQRADPEKHPHITRYNQIGLKHFLQIPAGEQLREVLGISTEQFPFVLQDVRRMQQMSKKAVLIEGANIRPQDVANIVEDVQRVFWLVPTEDFLLETYPRRGQWVGDVLRQYFADGERVDVFHNWMLRDTLHARWTAREAAAHGFRVLWVDGSTSVIDNAGIVADHFGWA